MNVGDYIKSLRQQNNMTQEELGKLLGVKRAAVQKWECGKVQNLKRTTIQQLSDIFNVSPSTFIIGDENNYNLSESEKQLITNYRALDDIDKAEIRGEIKQMLKAPKYTANKNSHIRPIKPHTSYEIAAWRADGTEGTYKAPKREIT